MLKKGKVIAQITNGVNKTVTDKKERNSRVLIKFFKTVYFMARKKMSVKENSEDLIKVISQEIGDDKIQKHKWQKCNIPVIFFP